MLYFDHNATAPLGVAAKEAWLAAQEVNWLNPSSPYRAAARVRARYEAARDGFAELVGVRDSACLIFNSGATEGNNQIFSCLARQYGKRAAGMRVILSSAEHISVLEGAKRFWPGKIEMLPVHQRRRPAEVALTELLEQGAPVALVSVIAAHNETGTLQDWAGLCAICKSFGVPFHTDASQWVGRLPSSGLGACDWITACAHKFGGPRGVGFLKVPGDGREHAGQSGGGQEFGLRAGTEDVVGVLAWLAQLRAYALSEAERTKRESWKGQFEETVLAAVRGSEVIGKPWDRLWNTTCLLMPERAQTFWIKALEKRGILVSSGSACSGGWADSRVIESMGFTPTDAQRVVRISSGPDTSESDWVELGKAVVAVGAELKNQLSKDALDKNTVLRIPN